MRPTDKTEQLCSVLTINIVGYVAFCERLAGLNMMNFLNQHYFSLLHAVILENDGLIGPMIGDVQIASWPLSGKGMNAHGACLTASQVLARVAVDQQSLPPEQRFELRIGIATGAVLDLGQQLLGDVVNLSSRLSGLASAYLVRVLVDSDTAKQSALDTFRLLDTVHVKGKGPMEIYELVEAS